MATVARRDSVVDVINIERLKTASELSVGWRGKLSEHCLTYDSM
jgi:hypothetical protein